MQELAYLCKTMRRKRRRGRFSRNSASFLEKGVRIFSNGVRIFSKSGTVGIAYLCIFGRGETAAHKSPVVAVVLVALRFALNARVRAKPIGGWSANPGISFFKLFFEGEKAHF